MERAIFEFGVFISFAGIYFFECVIYAP